MPLTVSCDCGKSFQVPEKYLGQQVKCPACSKATLVESAEPTTKPVAIRCTCGKLMAVAAKYAGRAVKCPACGKGIKVPELRPSPVPQASGAGTAPRQSGGLGDLLHEVGLQMADAAHRCPECKRPAPEETVLCVHCGYHFDSGKKLNTKVIGKSKSTLLAGGPGSAAVQPSSATAILIKPAVFTVIGMILFGVTSLLSAATLKEWGLSPILVSYFKSYFSSGSLILCLLIGGSLGLRDYSRWRKIHDGSA